jgi:hypothetical protein
VLAEISEKDEPEVKEDEPTIQKTEDPLLKVREVILDVKNVETNMDLGRSMWNARPLAEFNQSGWINGRIGLRLEDEWERVDIEQVLQEGPSPQGDSLCAIEAYTLANQDMEALNDEEKSESTMSNLDDMWYMGDKESNIQDFEDEDWDDNVDFKQERNANVVDGLHVPRDEMEGWKKVTKRHLHSLRLIRLQHR